MEKRLMRERLSQIAAAMIFGLMLGAGNGPAAPATATAAPTTAPVLAPTTRPAPTTLPVVPPTVQPVPEKHEPVALPPPPTSTPPAPVTAPAAVVPTTQAVVAPPPPPPAPSMVMKPTTQPGPIDEKVAYAIGNSVGRRIHDRLQEDGRTADDLMVLKGFIDGMSGKDSAYSQQEVQAAFAEFEAYTQQHRAEKMYADNPKFRKDADENLQKSRAMLDQNAEMAGVEVKPDGVQIQELNAGNGRVVGNAKTLTVKSLRVSLADGTLVKTTEGDQTEKIVTVDALPALMDAIRGMRVGTKCRIWLPSDKAYGLTGKPPVIGPNEGIEYEFELIGVE